MSSRRGTTLPELLVVLAIMGILLYLAQRVVVSGYEFYRSTDESITLQREGLLALTRLTEDLGASHHTRVNVLVDTVTVPFPDPPQPDDYRQDEVVIPLPKRLSDGKTDVDSSGAAKWMSIVGYRIDDTQKNRPLIRYIADTVDVVAGGEGGVIDLFYNSGDYTVNVETVTNMPTVNDIIGYGSTVKNVAAKNVLEFAVTKSIDVVEVELTISLTGRVKQGMSMDNSLTLRTTAYCKN